MPAVQFDVRVALTQPYPGLRAFEPSESVLFFGRQVHTNELLGRLSTTRMLAVVGTSGSGKSSLVRAGLLPALQRGHLAGTGSHWRLVIMRPGIAPLDEIVNALVSARLFHDENRRELRRLIGSTSLGLIEGILQSSLESSESLLLVVDQFEELFRFRPEQAHEDASAEARLFVAALLEAVDQMALPIYVVLTMRSDFLGDCAQFPGLSEALNRCQYLIPRMTREQRQEAIEGPMRLAGFHMSPRLVQRLLNDAGEDPDQLPVLQHALMRAFQRWQALSSEGDIDLLHYEDAGGMADALNRHAEDIYFKLSDEEKRYAEKIFRCLTTTEAGRSVRRLARLDQIMEVIGVAEENGRKRVQEIVRRFAARENSLLVLTTGLELRSDTVIDISHESLIRKWDRLRAWAKREAESVEWYFSLVNDARLYEMGAVGLWRDPDLKEAIRRSSEDGWNSVWASQYASGFQRVMNFVQKSQRMQRRRRLMAIALTAMILIVAGISYIFYRRKTDESEHMLVQLRQERARSEDQLYQARHEALELEGKLASASDPAIRRALEKQLQESMQEQQRAKSYAESAKKQLGDIYSQSRGTDDHVQLLAKQVDDLQTQLNQARENLTTCTPPTKGASNRQPQTGQISSSQSAIPDIARSVYFPIAQPTAKDSNGGLLQSQKDSLLDLANGFKKYLVLQPDAYLTLEGHTSGPTDQEGGVFGTTSEYDHALQERRVLRVRSFLTENGVPVEKIQTKLFISERQPSADEVKKTIDSDASLTPTERARLLRNMKIIVNAAGRRVDITLEVPGFPPQNSLHRYPLNAPDALTLIGGKTPTP